MNDIELQQLVHRQQISDVLITYCNALDKMDLTAIEALFTDDCFVDYGPGKLFQSRGAAALAKSLERMWRWSRTSHHLSNIQIDFVDATSASAVSYVHAWHERQDGTTATILGQYHDELIHEDRRWRIARRRMVMNGCDAGFTVDINPFERFAPPDDWIAPDID
jgi:3-phenylpropionate/cinnamic acid dioxygenase small subunit